MSLNRLPQFLFLLSLSIVALLLTTQAAETGKVDINRANKWTLAQVLHGVGEKKAAAIVAFREQHGAFKSADELTQVYGISQKLVDGNRDNIVVSDVKIIPKRKIPHVVNINTADVMTLSRELQGVGYNKAEIRIKSFCKNPKLKLRLNRPRQRKGINHKHKTKHLQPMTRQKHRNR